MIQNQYVPLNNSPEELFSRPNYPNCRQFSKMTFCRVSLSTLNVFPLELSACVFGNAQKLNSESTVSHKRTRKSKFQSLIIEKDFPPESPKDLESLDDTVCRWPIGHPNEKNFYFCGRKTIKLNNREFSYCKLHLLYAYQSKDKKEEVVVTKEDDVPIFLEKKIKSA